DECRADDGQVEHVSNATGNRSKTAAASSRRSRELAGASVSPVKTFVKGHSAASAGSTSAVSSQVAPPRGTPSSAAGRDATMRGTQVIDMLPAWTRAYANTACALAPVVAIGT